MCSYSVPVVTISSVYRELRLVDYIVGAFHIAREILEWRILVYIFGHPYISCCGG